MSLRILYSTLDPSHLSNLGIYAPKSNSFIMSDSIWQEDSDYEETAELDNWESSLSMNELNRIKTKFEKLGVREGILNHKDSHGQPGFDQGFKEGLQLGKTFGILHGVSWFLTQFESAELETTKKAKLSSLAEDLHALEIDDVFDREYFKQHPNQLDSSDPLQATPSPSIPDVNSPPSPHPLLNFLPNPVTHSATKADKLYHKHYSKLLDLTNKPL